MDTECEIHLGQISIHCLLSEMLTPPPLFIVPWGHTDPLPPQPPLQQ